MLSIVFAFCIVKINYLLEYNCLQKKQLLFYYLSQVTLFLYKQIHRKLQFNLQQFVIFYCGWEIRTETVAMSVFPIQTASTLFTISYKPYVDQSSMVFPYCLIPSVIMGPITTLEMFDISYYYNVFIVF